MEHYSKREFMRLSLMGFMGIVAGISPLCNYAVAANHPSKSLNWDTFLSRIREIAQMQYHKPWNNTSQLAAMIDVLKNCHFAEYDIIKNAINAYSDRTPHVFEHDLLYKEYEFQISLLHFEKGEEITPHDHPEMCGVMSVISGEIFVSNYTRTEDLDKTRMVNHNQKNMIIKSCLLKKESEQMLRSGNLSSLETRKGNIHALTAHSQSHIIDIFTPAYNPVNEQSSLWYHIDHNKLQDQDRETFVAEYVASIE